MVEKSVFCPACGKENAAGATTCKSCGVVLGQRLDLHPGRLAVSKPARKIGPVRIVLWFISAGIALYLLFILVLLFGLHLIDQTSSLGLGGAKGSLVIAELGALQRVEAKHRKSTGYYGTFEEMEQSGVLNGIAEARGKPHPTDYMFEYSSLTADKLETDFGVFVLDVTDRGNGYLIVARKLNGMKTVTVNEKSENAFDKAGRKMERIKSVYQRLGLFPDVPNGKSK